MNKNQLQLYLIDDNVFWGKALGENYFAYLTNSKTIAIKDSCAESQVSKDIILFEKVDLEPLNKVPTIGEVYLDTYAPEGTSLITTCEITSKKTGDGKLEILINNSGIDTSDGRIVFNGIIKAVSGNEFSIDLLDGENLSPQEYKYQT